MSYKTLRDAVNDLEKTGQLVRVKTEVDPNLEMAEIHRRVFDAKGPAILFEKVKGSPFQAVSNLYGTYERTDFLFRNTLRAVEKVVALKIDPTEFFKKPLYYAGAPLTALKALPMRLPLSPWGDCGGGFWVVARYGMQCLYYNDIEEGFNNSPVNADGIMTSYGCNQTSLLDFIRHVIIG